MRAVFAAIEAVVEQHKKLLLDLSANRFITLDARLCAAFTERTYGLDDQGELSTREQYLNLKKKLRGVYRIAGEAFGGDPDIRYDGRGLASVSRCPESERSHHSPEVFSGL